MTFKQFFSIFLALCVIFIPIAAQQQVSIHGRVNIHGRTNIVLVSTSDIPSEFSDLFTYQLARFNYYYTNTVVANWDGVKRRPSCMGAELTAADSVNVAAAGYYATNVTPMLNRFADMGINCVKVQIGFPNLYRPYYDWLWNGAGCSHNSSGGAHCASTYADAQWNAEVAFFQTLRADLTARSMKLNVQSAVQGSAGSELNVPSLAYYYDTINFTGSGGKTSYQEGRTTNVVNVLTLVQPDWINIASEPGHEYAQVITHTTGLTAIPEMTSASSNCANPNVFANCIYRQSVTTLITAILSGIAGIPLDHGVTKVAAGVANGAYIWSILAADEAALPGIDLLDSHLHALTNGITGSTPASANDSIAATATIADIAAAAGLGFGMNEESDDKSRPGSPGPTPSEQGGFGQAAIYDRQWYTFWNPDQDPTHGVDLAYIRTLLDLISWKKKTMTVYYFIYSEPYEFFSALNYSTVPGCPPPSTTCTAGTITGINNTAANNNIKGAASTASILTNIGLYYQNTIP